MQTKRGSGILLHISSLPTPYGVGDLGPSAYKFADFLAQTRQKYWQVLPINPTIEACMHSPYSSISAFAGNTLFISPDLMMLEGFLTMADLEHNKPHVNEHKTDYKAAEHFKAKLFDKAFKNFKSKKDGKTAFERFCEDNQDWLDDFALFSVIRGENNGLMWSEWKKKLRDRNEQELAGVKKNFKEAIEKEKFLQYIFFKQWGELKAYCNKKGVYFIGDMPIYVNYDSVDVWTNFSMFKLDKDKEPEFVAGVPPDYFSPTGQLWGNPVYDWEALKKDNYKWWIKRMDQNLKLFDVVRIDHFRGLVAYWEVPNGEETAINGKWVDAPAEDFFNTLTKHCPDLPIIAEDLGTITQDVKDILAQFKLPGMKVLLFAFNEDYPMHPYLPHTYHKNWVVYTGTHDNNTVKGWWDNEANHDVKNRVFRYLGKDFPAHEVNWALIRLAMMSVANVSIFPLQDIFGLGEEARMNKPSTIEGNWTWRMSFDHINSNVLHRLGEMTWVYGRV